MKVSLVSDCSLDKGKNMKTSLWAKHFFGTFYTKQLVDNEYIVLNYFLLVLRLNETWGPITAT